MATWVRARTLFHKVHVAWSNVLLHLSPADLESSDQMPFESDSKTFPTGLAAADGSGIPAQDLDSPSPDYSAPNTDATTVPEILTMPTIPTVPAPSLIESKQMTAPLHAEQNLLKETRAKWHTLLDAAPVDGGSRYVIPKEFFDMAINLDATSMTELTSFLGKLNCSTIVDENGALHHEDSEPIPSMHVSPELFHSLVDTFGLDGMPVMRNILKESETSYVLERVPPYFIIHTLTDSANARLPSYHDRTLRQAQCISLSQTKTFSDLVYAIQTCVYKGHKVNLRVWFVSSEKIAELPSVVSISMFVNDIAETKVVEPKVMDLTLRSQGVHSSTIHLVVEPQNKLTQDFPLDQYITREETRVEQGLNPGGNLGLSNLGNTCYMNSALQCLVHVPEVCQYFFYDLYERELNRKNPLGNNGEVATSFSNLIHKLFDPKSGSSVTPREFKYTIGRYSSMFHGYQQQDTQEFLSWLLDALHEDLNRIHKKPYTEKPELKDEDIGNMEAIIKLARDCWDLYKQRNDSIIVDLFTGLYQSTLVCPVCEKQSITFDPFNDFTLPLPVSKNWYHTFTIVLAPDGSEASQIYELEVELSKTSNLDELKAYLGEYLGVDPTHLFLFEIFRNYFYKDYQTSMSVNNFIPISELISDDDNVIVYVIPHDPTRDLIVPVVNIVQDADVSYSIKEPFGIPLFVVCDKLTDIYSFGSIRAKVEQAVKLLTRENLEEQYPEARGTGNSKYFSSDDFPLIKRECGLADEKMEGASPEDTDGYDSDISLAHPSVSASFGFEMKVYESSFKGYRGSQRHMQQNNAEAESGGLRIPHGRPNFKNLAPLAAKLPALKRKYYHYPELVAQNEAEEYSGLSQDSRKYYAEAKANGFEVVGSNNHGSQNVSSIQPVSSGGKLSTPLSDADDSDAGSNWVDVEPLLLSEGKLPESGSEIDQATDNKHLDESFSGASTGLASTEEKRPPLLSSNSMLVIEWEPEVYKQFFDSPESQTWSAPCKIPNSKVEASKKQWSLQEESTISLHDCLKSFSIPEVLGGQDLWYCPKCKDHRRATKTIQLWSTGDILTIHLKRFQSARRFSDKISSVVDFPIEGLDMSEYVNSPVRSEDLVYDLIAIDNHFGGLGGGHYTASVLNFKDNKWYYFNDSRVTPIEDPKECITSAAYLLFYKRRTASKFAGGFDLESLLEKGRAAYDEKLKQRQVLIQHISKQISEYYGQMSDAAETHVDVNANDATEEAGYLDDDEDLYADTPDTPGNSVSNKKLRSPMSEQTMKFEVENQKKQRLISQSTELPRPVNMNLGYSSSASNLASPAGSSSSEEEAIFD